MLERWRDWLSESAPADQPAEDSERGWGLSLWWGAVIVALFTVAITLCNDPGDLDDALAAPTTTGVTPTPTVAPDAPTLPDLIAAQPELFFFRSLIDTAGIAEILATGGEFTFFAPTDAAFAELPDDILERLIADADLANQVLQRHATFGRRPAADLIAAATASTVSGQPVTITQADGTVFIDDVAVIEADILAMNGVLHIIDGLLGAPTTDPSDQPPLLPALGEILQSRGDLSTLRQALGAVEGDLFGAPDAQFTVFAPTDTAFAALPAGTLEVLVATEGRMFEVLGYHIVADTILAADLADGDVLVTTTGAELPVAIADGEITVGGVVVREADLIGANGAIHIVDEVLLPPGFEIPTINEALDLAPITFETGSAVITAAGVEVLRDAVDFLAANPQIRVAVEGHTDSQGGEAANQALSESRAESVLAFLVAEGIAADRLETIGFGETRPIADNATAEGRAQNRRIEFRLLG